MNRLIGAKIRALREKKNYTQFYVADSIGVSQPTLARIENGVTNTWVNYIDKICGLFNIEVNELLIPDDIKILKEFSDGEVKKAIMSDIMVQKLINQLNVRLDT